MPPLAGITLPGCTLLALSVAALVAGCGAARHAPVAASPTQLTAVSGEPLSFQPEALERPTLLVFWASWCAPCRAEAPTLLALEARLRGKLDLVGVNVDESVADARAFVATFGIDYPSLHDPELSFSDGRGVEGVPMLILLAPGGAEVARASALGDLEDAIACQAEGKACP